MPEADLPTIRRVYHSLRLIRRFEEEVARIYPEDKIKSPVHLSIGQESVAVGVCDVLEKSDLAGGTYRGHAVYMAKGGDINALMAELYGKATGCTQGKGGSMHLMDIKNNVIGSSAVVGTTIPIALGYGIALKREGKGRVVTSFMGDGSTEEGVFHESLNFAALKRLPVIFVLENNFYAIHTPIGKRQAVPDAICERVKTYGIPAYRVTDADVFKIRDIVADALPKMRRGEYGPIFIECHTYRWKEHVGPANDYDAGYRSTDELKPWIDNDQIPIVAAMLDPDDVRKIDAKVEKQVAAAIEFAEKSPFPAASELSTHVYA
jgi:TPP-dependent pyruvate/acetoin dehydrogenase alpha subunit